MGGARARPGRLLLVFLRSPPRTKPVITAASPRAAVGPSGTCSEIRGVCGGWERKSVVGVGFGARRARGWDNWKRLVIAVCGWRGGGWIERSRSGSWFVLVQTGASSVRVKPACVISQFSNSAFSFLKLLDRVFFIKKNSI